MTTFTAQDIFEAFKKIDGGCTSCMASFLDDAPQSLAEELATMYNADADQYVTFAKRADRWEKDFR